MAVLHNCESGSTLQFVSNQPGVSTMFRSSSGCDFYKGINIFDLYVHVQTESRSIHEIILQRVIQLKLDQCHAQGMPAIQGCS